MSDILSLTATEARAALDKRDLSAVELASAYIGAIEETAALNNYVAVTADHALEMAAQSDARIADGSAGLIEGIPVGVKVCSAQPGLPALPVRGFWTGLHPPMKVRSQPICGMPAALCLAS